MDAFMIKNMLTAILLEEEPELFITFNGLTTDIYIDNIMDITISDGKISCSDTDYNKEFIIDDNDDIYDFVRDIFPQLIA